MNPSAQDIRSIFGIITLDDGRKIINSIIVNRVWARSIIVEGDVLITGTLTANTFKVNVLNVDSLQLGNGSALLPALSFASDPTTGIYKTAGGMGFSAGGALAFDLTTTGALFTAPITSSVGVNLTFGSSTSVIDFSGSTLINVAGISANANRYEVIAPSVVITTDATPTILYSIPTVSNATYTINTDITCADDIGNMDSAGFIVSAKGKNVAGVVSVSGNLENNSAIDAGLVGVSVIYSFSGTNITLLATGVSGKTIKWFGASTVTRLLF
jgi:hypothetical protein